MKNLTKTMLAVIVAGLVASALSMHEAQAAPPIHGTINFEGGVQFDSSALQFVTQVLEWYDVSGNAGVTNVAATTRDFSSIPLGTQATMATPWTFNFSTDTPQLWAVGGFNFHLLSATIVSQTATLLNVTGTGIISGNGFKDTAATWAFTVQNAGGDQQPVFSFSAQSASRQGRH